MSTLFDFENVFEKYKDCKNISLEIKIGKSIEQIDVSDE